MLNLNTYFLKLTGTTFGNLSNYEKVLYSDGYYFLDAFGNSNFTYNLTANSNNITTTFTDQEIKDIPNLVLWLDASDASNLKTRGASISGIVDKSYSSHFFIGSSAPSFSLPSSSNWPLTGTFLNNRTCIKLLETSFFRGSSFSLDLRSPFTIYFIWKDFNSSNGLSIPFCFKTFLNTGTELLTSELVTFTDYKNTPNLTWGNRNSYFGTRVESLSNTFFSENLIVWKFDSNKIPNGEVNFFTTNSVVTSQDLITNNNSLPITDTTFLSGRSALSATLVGYLSGKNHFLFGEMLVFDRVLEMEEDLSLRNTLYRKWNLPYFLDNTLYSNSISGGPFSNVSYEDFSALTSVVEIPVQSCITELTVNMQDFEQSVSKVSKIIYSYNNEQIDIPSFIDNNTYTIESITLQNGGSGYFAVPRVLTSDNIKIKDAILVPELDVKTTTITSINIIDGGLYKGIPRISIPGGLVFAASAAPTMVRLGTSLRNSVFTVRLIPSKNKFLDTYMIGISVLRFDSTVNKLILSGNILKCSIRDFYRNTSLLDAQLLEDSKELLLVTENKEKKLIFNNKINIDVPVQALTGSDIEPLVNKEISTLDDEEILLLSELLEDERIEREKFVLPLLPPLPLPKINPIRPE